MKALLAYAVAFGVLLAAPAMAQWTEQGDAGDLPATAQIPIGSGALTTIAGSLGTGDVDMYCIGITSTATFAANTCAAGAAFDTQLFVFRADGVGVIWDDDTCASGLQSEILAGLIAGCQYQTGPGNYYIAVSRYNNDPRNGTTACFTGTSCNTGAALVVNNWSGTTLVAGPYTITLAGTGYCAGATAVEPSTWGSIKNFYR